MSDKLFDAIRASARRSDPCISNIEALGLSADTRGVHILWMYPDVLDMHGGRGDAMALLHVSNLLKLPCQIMRINTLAQEIPFDWADLMLFPSGDLSCMADVSRALLSRKAQFQRFAAENKIILAIGSSGAILADRLLDRAGQASPGLGLLHMDFTQRTKVFGDDIWIRLPDGQEIIGNEIQLADVTLADGQEPFGQVIYGRGNDGTGQEGARTGNVIFTHCLGPVLTKNPDFTAYLLKLAAERAGIASGMDALPEDQISLEREALADVRAFIEKKIRGEIQWSVSDQYIT